MVNLDIVEERLIARDDWKVKRIGTVSEVVMANGQVKWRVQLRDDGRPAFIDQYFDRPDRAQDFFDRLQKEPGRID